MVSQDYIDQESPFFKKNNRTAVLSSRVGSSIEMAENYTGTKSETEVKSTKKNRSRKNDDITPIRNQD